MEVAKIKITGTDAAVSDLKKITSGMIGATVSIEYDDTWEGLNRQVVFQGPLGIVNADGSTIPHEVLRLSGHELKVGVYGYTDDGSRAIPTIWASLGMIQPGADPEGDESAAPTLPVWARMQNQIGNLDDLKTKARESLVAAINELQAAGVDEKEIQRIIGEYLEENEVGAQEIPTFDLSAMGIPAIPIAVAGETTTNCDTAALIKAFSKGMVYLKFHLEYWGTIFPAGGYFTGYYMDFGDGIGMYITHFMNFLCNTIVLAIAPDAINVTVIENQKE